MGTATWRQRQRESTVEEIKAVARELLEESGGQTLTIRDLARRMGIVASALYRYFPSRDAILSALIHDAYAAQGGAVEQAIAEQADADLGTRILAAVHAFRSWAVANEAEYGLIYGTPVPGYVAECEEGQPQVAPARTPRALLALLMEGIATGVVTPPDAAPIAPEILDAAQSVALGDSKEAFAGIPGDVVVVALQFWVVLYGAVSAEVFHHIPGMLREGSAVPEAFFDLTMRSALLAIGADPAAVAAATSPRPPTPAQRKD